ncbi:MAG TPA: DEAD/DEAH box helicase [Persephonella sp.]|nr:DEAD/DEAH box helicase [Persephonella sp.]
MKVILQKIAENYIKDIPTQWLNIDLDTFGIDYNLFDYQKQALENTVKVLYQYQLDKEKLYQWYKLEGLTGEIEENLTIGSYPFKQLINRASFWMATGSGKTIVMIKLIEILHSLIKNSLIPQKPIMILAPRDEILNQIKNHIELFNKRGQLYINLINLKKWEDTNQLSFFDNQINVYYYRADNITEENKDKQIDYKTFLNNGNWYVLLDEAHKGDKQESKRQLYYTQFSKNGFLFNFSATFKDDIDIITTVYNFNLQKFLSQGYGKKIYIANSEFKNFKPKKDKEFSSEEKKLQLAKSLILFAYIKEKAKIIKSIKENLYHYPLLITLANKVHTEDAELKIFFILLSEIALDKFDFETAKNELVKDLKENPNYIFGLDEIDFIQEIQTFEKQKFFENVFNSKNPSKIEYVRIKGNDREILFKLKNSTEHFMLIVADKIIKWEDDTLEGYEKSETVEESLFKDINERKDINILLGSRIFTEGWDSNRPNVINFINIGVNEEAVKFVLQAIGRGIRINPFNNERKRFDYLNKEILNLPREKIAELSNNIKPLESLFVFATNKKVIKAILEQLRKQGETLELRTLKNIEKNKYINEKQSPLLVPEFEETGVNNNPYPISDEELNELEEFINNYSEKAILIKNNAKVRTLKQIKNKKFTKTGTKTGLPIEKLIKNIDNFFNKPAMKFKGFSILENQITHFKRIQTDLEDIQTLEKELLEIIEKFYKENEFDFKTLEEKVKKGEISFEEAFRLSQQKSLYTAYKILGNIIDYNLFKEHYYVPILSKEKSKQTAYFRNIIENESEIRFLRELKSYLDKPDNKAKEFDWWYFSKLVEKVDLIKIPYFDTQKGVYQNFYPDFIFWMKKDSKYFIKFVDPKGVQHGQRNLLDKIQGFEDFKKEAQKENLDISLILLTKDKTGNEKIDKYISLNFSAIF